MNDVAEPPVRTLIDELLAEQQQLTAVERFARKHERDALPAQSRYYRELIPLSRPAPGEQYAFAVDLDICTGCKACVSACHSLNGLDEDEIWRNIGFIHNGDGEEPYQQTVTTACHHCVEPACLEGCPVRAYEKDAETGIVRHLDDQCIGCQYCILKCPYDVPKYSEKRGIVRKCDMCYGRLSVGEAPACVQACPSGAITIRIVAKGELVEDIEPGDRLLPGAFESSYTKPTTVYTSRRPIPDNARPGDDRSLRLEHAHWPLIWMLLLTQLAAGMYIGMAGLAAGSAELFQTVQAPLAVAAFALLNLGLGVSVLHLGRPLGAWRAFLGLRTSWMSREIFAFSFFAMPAGALVGACLWDWAAQWVPQLHTLEVFGSPAQWSGLLAGVTAVLGLFGVLCSAMIYVDTRRAFWASQLTFTKFFGTTALLGSAAVAAILDWTSVWMGTPIGHAGGVFLAIAVVLQVAFFGWEFLTLRTAESDPAHPIHRSALTMSRLLKPLLIARAAALGVAVVFGLTAFTQTGLSLAILATLSLASAFVAQVVERYFFFAAVFAPRMPGPLVPDNTVHP